MLYSPDSHFLTEELEALADKLSQNSSGPFFFFSAFVLFCFVVVFFLTRKNKKRREYKKHTDEMWRESPKKNKTIRLIDKRLPQVIKV